MYKTVDDLISALQDHPTSSFGELIAGIRFGVNELSPYIHHNDDFYTRNLIFANDKLEALLLCWPKDAITAIHDHAGAEGWMMVVSGTIEEVVYRTKDTKDPAMKRLERKTVKPGDLSYISDHIGLHSIANIGTGRALSLHVYSPKIESCGYFDRPDGPAKNRSLSYYSAYGKKL